MTFRAAEGGNVVAARPAEMQTRMPSWSRSFAVTIVFLLLAVVFGCLAGSLGFLITESGIAADIQNWIAKIAPISREDRAIQASKPVVPAAPTATMRGIKHQLLGDVITITISLDKSVQYETHRLHDPERIVIDLRGARLDPKLHRIIEVNQGGLLVIRLSQFKPETARIVLDLARQSDYWINATADPPRLIINLSKRELEDGPFAARCGALAIQERGFRGTPTA
jgi:hypothetical protein